MANTRLPSLNKVIIVGNLVRDPELRYTSGGVPVVNFKIASNKKYKDNLGMYKEDVCYVGVVAWQDLAQNCSEYLRKGSAVLVEGELRSRTKENEDGSKRNYLEIKAFQVQFLDKRTEPVSLREENVLNLSKTDQENLADFKNPLGEN
ncbi:MAG: single-stranded DNA-binding protein [Candidatus Zixiibacteriota bacterium]